MSPLENQCQPRFRPVDIGFFGVIVTPSKTNVNLSFALVFPMLPSRAVNIYIILFMFLLHVIWYCIRKVDCYYLKGLKQLDIFRWLLVMNLNRCFVLSRTKNLYVFSCKSITFMTLCCRFIFRLYWPTIVTSLSDNEWTISQ